MTPSPLPLSREGETGLFGDCAVKLWSGAAILLGWRPDEFWNATPAELAHALRPPVQDAERPSASVIEELRRRFPDQ